FLPAPAIRQNTAPSIGASSMTTIQTATLVLLDDLYFTYRLEPALRVSNWRWQANERWAVMGGNGAGKTTLARLLRDEMRPQRGSIVLAADIEPERDIVYVSFAMQRALIEHDNRFDDSETNGEGVDVGTTVRSAILQGRTEDARFRELVSSFGIEHILQRGIRYISTGEGRKTLLARALFAAPKMLILDNPLEGLDRAMQAELAALIEQLLGGNTPLLLLLPTGSTLPRGVTHVLELERGEVISCGTRAAYEATTHDTAPTAGDSPLPEPLLRATPVALEAPPIEMRGVNVSYNDEPILADIHWRFERGRHCCISGRNGAGKSTLLSLITGDNHKGYGQPLFLFGRKRGSGESVWELKANC